MIDIGSECKISDAKKTANDWKGSALRLGYILASNPSSNDFTQKIIVISVPCESAIATLITLGAQALAFEKFDSKDVPETHSIAQKFRDLPSGTELYDTTDYTDGGNRSTWIKLCAQNLKCKTCKNHNKWTRCESENQKILIQSKPRRQRQRYREFDPPLFWRRPEGMVGTFIPREKWEERDKWGIGYQPYPQKWENLLMEVTGFRKRKFKEEPLIFPYVASALVCSRLGVSKSARLAEEITFPCGNQTVQAKELLTTNNPIWQRHRYPWFTHVECSRRFENEEYFTNKFKFPLVVFEGMNGYLNWKQMSKQQSFMSHQVIILSRSGSAAEQQENCDILRHETQYMNAVGLEWFEKEGVFFPEGISMLIWEKTTYEEQRW